MSESKWYNQGPIQETSIGRNRNAPRCRQIAAALGLAGAMALGMTSGIGCGSGRSGAPSTLTLQPGNGSGGRSALLVIAWPEITRHIPFAADQIRVQVVATNNPANGTDAGRCFYGTERQKGDQGTAFKDVPCSAAPFVADRPDFKTGVGEITPIKLTQLPANRDLRLVITAHAREVDNGTPGTVADSPVADSRPAQLGGDVLLNTGADATVSLDGELYIDAGTVTLKSVISYLEVNNAELRPDGKGNSTPLVSVTARDARNNIVLLRRADTGETNTDVIWTGNDYAEIDNNRVTTAVRRKTGVEVPQKLALAVTYKDPDGGDIVHNPEKVGFLYVRQGIETLLDTVRPATGVSSVPAPVPGLVAFSLVGYNDAAPGAVASTLFALVGSAEVSYSGRTYSLNNGRLSDIVGIQSDGSQPSPSFLAVQEEPTGVKKIAAYYAPAGQGQLTRSSNPATSPNAVQIVAMGNTAYVLNAEGVLNSYTVQTSAENTVYSTSFTGETLIDSLAGANKLAVGRENDGGGTVFTYLASGVAVQRQGKPSVSVGAGSFLDAELNPGGAALTSITDIAAEGHYLYVLDAESRQIHVFNSDMQWLYSMNAGAPKSGGTPEQISATHLPNGDGVLLMVYGDGSFARYYRTRVP